MAEVNPVTGKKVWTKPTLIKLSEEEVLKKGVKLIQPQSSKK